MKYAYAYVLYKNHLGDYKLIKIRNFTLKVLPTKEWNKLYVKIVQLAKRKSRANGRGIESVISSFVAKAPNWFGRHSTRLFSPILFSAAGDGNFPRDVATFHRRLGCTDLPSWSWHCPGTGFYLHRTVENGRCNTLNSSNEQKDSSPLKMFVSV